MRQHLTLPNLITSASLAAGFVALLLAADGHLVAAAFVVAGAVVLNASDGVVARRLSLCGRFGSELDSLADLVAFGVAPALMLHRGALDTLPLVGAIACVAFVLAGAWRLARFPLVANVHHFVGLPIPAAGLLLAVVAAVAPPAGVALVVALVLAALMFSAIPFPTLVTLRRDAQPRRRVGHAVQTVRRARGRRLGRRDRRRARLRGLAGRARDRRRSRAGRPEGEPHEDVARALARE
jgi:CDP-diacylglycerol--serine O-phosphatidyltransferase